MSEVAHGSLVAVSPALPRHDEVVGVTGRSSMVSCELSTVWYLRLEAYSGVTRQFDIAVDGA